VRQALIGLPTAKDAFETTAAFGEKLALATKSAPDKQISLTDPDARSMKTRGTGSRCGHLG
jgi:hypothetical protein